jgi:nucleotide-binding universal stress UspA family protein
MKEVGNLVDYSCRLARDLKKELDLLRTVNLKNYPMGIPIVEKPNYQHGEIDVENIIKELNSEMHTEIINVKRRVKDPPQINYFTEKGISRMVINDYTKTNRYDYIILSSNTNNEYLINDRNMDIITHTEIPVWVIPHNAAYKPLKSLIYATDREEEDIPTMKRIAKLAEKNSAKITSVHVVENNKTKNEIQKKGNLGNLREKVGYNYIEFLALPREKDKRLDEVIIKFAKQIGATLIVVIKENENFFEKLFRRSTTKNLIDLSDIPVLVFRENIYESVK